MTALSEYAASAMGTVVSVQIASDRDDAAARARDAFTWCLEVERCCSRFDAQSELSRLTRTRGTDVPVSAMLFALLEAACAVAAASDGAFDPTVGRQLRARGLDRSFRTGLREAGSGVDEGAPVDTNTRISWRDIALDPVAHTVRLHRTLELDLGAIAKGFAVDLVSHALAEFPDVAINAGGDLACRGHNAEGRPWSAGIRDPHDASRLVARVALHDVALCTSGNYAHREHGMPPHLVNPLDLPATMRNDDAVASVSVAAPSAMMADALATAAFVLGVDAGRVLLEHHDADGLFVRPDGTTHTTRSRHVTWVMTEPAHVAR